MSLILLFSLLTLVSLGTPPPLPKPPEFNITDLKISPSEVWIGQPVTISVKVANVGEAAGSYPVVLMINGVLEQTETVVLEGATSTKVEFTVIKKEEGSYSVQIYDLTGMFNVKAPLFDLWGAFLRIIA